MKKICFFLALCFSLQAGAQVLLEDSIATSTGYRHFLFYVPASYTPGTAAPLVINMHGLGSNDTQQLYYSNFMPIADTAGFLMVLPQGNQVMGTTYWNAGFGGPDDDVSFISNLIDTLRLGYNIDSNRIYATGMSNGGYMSYFLACHLPDRIAAIASVTGSIVPGGTSLCTPGRAVPVMQFHGTADATVPYLGGSLNIPVDSLIRFWVGNNHCDTMPVVTEVPDAVTSDGSTATHYVYSGGDNGSTVEFYKINGGEHTWPGSPFTIGVTNQDVAASAEIWRFFSQYSLTEFLGVPQTVKGQRHQPAYPNPAISSIQIAAPLQGNATLSDMAGRVLLQSASQQLDVSRLPKGIYLLQYQSGGTRIAEKIVKE